MTPAPLEQRAREVVGRPGDPLNDLARFYAVDGDCMQCRRCKRMQQVMWCHSTFQHRADCKIQDAAPSRPWLIMGNVVQVARSSLPPKKV